MESTKWYASAYKSVIAIDATMDHDTPPNQFVVAINVPEVIRPRDLVDSPANSLLLPKSDTWLGFSMNRAKASNQRELTYSVDPVE